MRIYLNYTALFISILLFWGNSSAQTTVPFTYTGSEQSWTVPAGVTSIDVKLWGAGGGGDYNGSSGGSGGFVKGTLAVTPGQILKIVVGEGGSKADNSAGNTSPAAGSYGGGGRGTSYGAAGGGYSGIFLSTVTQANAKVIAGGGGGSKNNSGNTTPAGGGGGDASATGGALQGASGNGGGGGGYKGGAVTKGGSSYTANLAPGFTATIGNTNSSGVSVQPPGVGESGYVTGVGNGGGKRTNGGNGLVIITYTVAVSADYFCELSDISKTTWCAGETATVSVKVKNAGTQNWTAGDNIRLIAKWNAGSWVDGQAVVLNKDADETYTVSMTAPAAGTHTLTFDLKKGSDLFSDNANGIGPGNTVLSNNAITVNGLPTANAGLDRTVSCSSNTGLGEAIVSGGNMVNAGCNGSALYNAGGSGITSVSTTDGINNFTNSTSGSSGYVDYSSSKQVEVLPGTVFKINVSGNSNTRGFRIWVDWNNDGDFEDAGELMWTSPSGISHSNIIITIPNNQPIGACRMRIRSLDNYAFSTENSCTKIWGETEDYAVKIINPYTYSWSPSDFLDNTAISNPTAVGITSTKTYTLIVTDGNNCSNTGNVTVTVTPSSLTSSPCCFK